MNIKELFNYDPETGILRWIGSRSNRVKYLDIAGTIGKSGYLMVGILDKRYQVHRVIWFYMYGKWPDGDIDHINGIKTDNRIENLRDVTRSVNKQNIKRANLNNKYKLLGVFWHKASKKYLAKIMLNGNSKHLGLFDCPQAAHEAYLQAKRELHEGNTL